MLAKRIIPCLDVQDGMVVKGIHFEGIREVGDPVECAVAYDRQGAVRGQRAGQVRGLARRGDDDAEALRPGAEGEFPRLLRRAVRAHHARLGLYAELAELPDGLFNDGPVAVAAHDYGGLLLSHALPPKKYVKATGLCP